MISGILLPSLLKYVTLLSHLTDSVSYLSDVSINTLIFGARFCGNILTMKQEKQNTDRERVFCLYTNSIYDKIDSDTAFPV